MFNKHSSKLEYNVRRLSSAADELLLLEGDTFEGLFMREYFLLLKDKTDESLERLLGEPSYDIYCI
jgi:hypothetical protein